MSLSVETKTKLMAYADGELEGSDRAAVEVLLASNVNAARFVQNLVLLGAGVSRGHAERDGAKVASFDIAASVMSRINSLQPTAIQKRVSKRTVYWGAGGVAAALAMAAAVFLVVRQESPTVPVQMALSATAPSERALPPVAEPRIESGIHVEVNAAEVFVIRGTQCEKPSVDPAIGEVPPSLKYNCYKLLEKKQLPLSKGQASSIALPNGRTIQITLHEGTSQKHYKVGAAISQPNGQGFLPLADVTAEPNKRFNVGGWDDEKGAIFLGIRILP